MSGIVLISPLPEGSVTRDFRACVLVARFDLGAAIYLIITESTHTEINNPVSDLKRGTDVWYSTYVMKISIGILLAGSLSVIPSLDADTVTCKDGRVIHGTITSETENELTIGLYGEQVVIPRSKILSITRATPEDNQRLEKEFEQLDAHYKEESREREKQDAENGPAEYTPIPFPTEPPPPDGDFEEPEVIVFPAYPPQDVAPPSGEAAPPGPPNRVQERLSWEQEVHQAIHQKRVIPGMTEKQVESAWGFPDLIHPVHGTYTYTDRWIYDRDDSGKVSVYFNNGIVVEIY
ncbi:MAG: hypothetical protein NTX71_06240 [Candidatus Aureabacteria bacterium]|nr:hypothetical protein [Candidatus Auribacterota bacterium]